MASLSNSAFEKMYRFSLLVAGLLFITILIGLKDGYVMPSTGFSLDTALVITDIEPDSTAHRAGFHTGDQILEVDGVPVQAGDRIAAQGRRVSVGATSIYKVRRVTGEIEILPLKWSAPTPSDRILLMANGFLTILLLGLAFLTICRQKQFSTAYVFFALTIVYIFFRMNHPRWTVEILARLYQALYLFGFFIIPPLFAHFCALFPRRSLFFYLKPGRILWLYAPSMILFLPAAIVNWTHYGDVRAIHLITKIILYQGFFLWGIYMLMGSLTMIRSFFRVRSHVLSVRSVIVFYSLLIAMLPYVLRSFLSWVWTGALLFDILCILFFIPVPTSIAWAIMAGEDKHEGLPWYLNRIIRSKEDK